MKERPILFSAPLVRAIIEGRKTQTRRVFKTPNGCHWYGEMGGKNQGWITDGSGWWHVEEFSCPYGKPGDRVWVRESWAVSNIYDKTAPSKICEDIPKGPGRPPTKVLYPATDSISDGIRRRPSIHMPRWASRITLEITGVRVERLNDISNEDCIAEGVSSDMPIAWQFGDDTPIGMFGELWESINGPDSWAENPWVWVVEFRRVSE